MPPQKDTRLLVDRTDDAFYDLPVSPNDYLPNVVFGRFQKLKIIIKEKIPELSLL